MGTVAQTRRLYRTWVRILTHRERDRQRPVAALLPFWALTIITLDIFVIWRRRPRRRCGTESDGGEQMAGKRHDEGRVCLCDRPDGSCAGLAVRRPEQRPGSGAGRGDLDSLIWELLPARPGSDPPASRCLGPAACAPPRPGTPKLAAGLGVCHPDLGRRAAPLPGWWRV